jgi:hypothetical protein
LQALTLRACPNGFFLFVVLFLVVAPTLFVLVLFVFFIVPVIKRQHPESLHFCDLEKIIAVYEHGNTPPRDSSIRLPLYTVCEQGSNIQLARRCHFGAFSFGSIRIDGVSYEHDVITDRGAVRKRKKKPSKQFREEVGHAPISVAEEFPGTANA